VKYRIALVLCLSASFLFSASLPLYAQDAEGPEVLVQSSPDPVSGASWTLSLLIDHPQPDEVTVLAPHFPGSLHLDRVLKSGRPMGDAQDAERWTVAEYRFLINSAESFEMDSFIIITPGRRVQTEPFAVDVHNAAAPRPVLVWERIPKELGVGEAASVGLKISGANTGLSFPQPRFFMPPLIKGAIIEAEALSNEDRKSSIVLRLRLTPLVAVPLVFPERELQYEKVLYKIPPMRIPVSPKPRRELAALEAVGSASLAEASIPEASSGFVPPREVLPFPVFEQVSPVGFFSRLIFSLARKSFSAAYKNVYLSAEDLWLRGCYADALAFIRRNERDLPLGFLLSGFRRQAELNCGLGRTKDEPPKLFNFFYSLAGPRSSRSCVLRETSARRVPDFEGELAARFREGQPARIRANGRAAQRHTAASPALTESQASWVWVETCNEDVFFGWVPEENVLYY
jgi:hypothetical protein